MKDLKTNTKMKDLRQTTILALEERGVSLDSIADIICILQGSYLNGLTREKCLENLMAILNKREVCNAVLTGIALDKAAENNLIEEPLLSIIRSDDTLYGVDEILPLSIVNIYGTIGLTNFGYLDRVKEGIIGELDSCESTVNTFLDDIVAALAASASARIAHRSRDE